MGENISVVSSLLQTIFERKQAIWLRIGSLHESVNSLDRAMVAYENCLTHNQSNVEALIKAGLLHMRTESIAPAINYLFTAVSLDPENGAAWSALAYSYVMTDDFDKAYYAYYNTLRKLSDHRDPNLWFGIGILYDRLGMLESALASFNAVVELDPAFDRLGEVLYSMGLIHKEQGNHNASYTYMAKIISIGASVNAQAEAWYQLGTLHDITGVATTASEAYHNALSRNQNHVKAMQALAWLMHRNGNDNEAVDMLQRAANCDEGNPETYYLIGRIYVANNEFRVAYDNYQQAVHLDDKNPYFWCSIASLYYHRQQHHDAIDAYLRAIQINPHMPDVWFDLGTLYEMHNQFGDAIDSYRQALQLHPHNALISQRIQAVQQGMVGGVPLSRPSGKPSCDTPDASPTTRSGQRLHYKSDAPSRYGHLPAPPSSGLLTGPGTVAQHGRMGKRAEDAPVSSGVLDDRHQEALVVLAGAQNLSVASPMRNDTRVANEHDGKAPTASNVTVTSPDSNRDSVFPHRLRQNLLTDSQLISRGTTEHSSQPRGAAFSNAEGVNDMTRSPQAKTEIDGSSDTLRIPSSRPDNLAPISSRLSSLVRSSQDANIVDYSKGQQGSKPEVTVASRDQNGPEHDPSPQGTPDFPLNSTNGTASGDAPLRPDRNGQSRNGKTESDGLAPHSAGDDNKRIAPSAADTRVNFLQVGDKNAAYSSYPGSVHASRSVLEHSEDKNQGQSQGVPVSSASLATPNQHSMEREAPHQIAERHVCERQSIAGTVAPHASDLSHTGDTPIKDGLGVVNGKPNFKPGVSRDPSLSSVPSPAKKSPLPIQTVNTTEGASGRGVGENEHNSKAIDGNEAHSDSKENPRSDYHPFPRVSMPASTSRFGLNTSTVKDDSPVDEEMLPRLPPLPPNSDHKTGHQDKDDVAAGEERFGEYPKGIARLSRAENKQSSEGPSLHGGDSNIRGDRIRGMQEPGLKSGEENSRLSPAGNGTPRFGGQRTGFSAIIQEPAMSQSQIFKSKDFPEFRSTREGVSFTKPSNQLPRDDKERTGIKQGTQNGDFESKSRQVDSTVDDGRRSPNTRSSGACGGSDGTRERGQTFGALPLRKNTQVATTVGSPSSNRASPERTSATDGNYSGMQPTFDNGAHDKMEKNLSHRVVPPTGIRSSLAAGSGGLSIKRSGFERMEVKNVGDKDDRGSRNDSKEVNRVSSLRNPFGGGISSSFAKPTPRCGGVGNVGTSPVQELGGNDTNGRTSTSEVGGYGPRRDKNQDQMSTLGKRNAASFESGNFTSGESGETNKLVPKSVLAGPSIENRLRSSDVELREPRFLAGSSQYMPSRGENHDVKGEKKGESEGFRRFNSGELR